MHQGHQILQFPTLFNPCHQTRFRTSKCMCIVLSLSSHLIKWNLSHDKLWLTQQTYLLIYFLNSSYHAPNIDFPYQVFWNVFVGFQSTVTRGQ